MKLTMNIYLEELEEIVDRTILVNDNLSLQTFCEYVIVIMNGNPKEPYSISINDDEYLSFNCEKISEEEKYIGNITLKELNLNKNTKIFLYYKANYTFNFYAKITNIEKSSTSKDFELITGKGLGVIADIFSCTSVINFHLNPPKQEFKRKGFREVHDIFLSYDYKNFNHDIFNKKIDNYAQILKERTIPKNYILHVSLEYLGKQINRKIAINSNVSLDKVCKTVITSMQGDLTHAYTIKIRNDYLENIITKSCDLSYLDLKEKQRFKIIYDYGDNWIFKITISKINIGYKERNIEVLSGKGYGIIDDCGGIGALEEIFNGTSEYWEYQDINEFNLEENNKMIEKYL